MQGPFLRKYGVQTTINFHLFEIDGVNFRVDAADGGTDCSIMKDEGAEATCTNDFTDEGTGYSLVLTATEMQAARIVVYVVDTITKVWLDTAIVVETYGNASAMHAIDLADSVRAGLTALPNAAADGVGGLPISDAGGLDLDTILGRITANVALASVCTEARLAELAAANIPADIDTLLTRITAAVALASICTEGRLAELDAANLPADIAGLNNLSAAQVNAEVDTALSDIKLDHLVAVAESDDPVDNSIIAKLAASDGDWSGFDESTDSLEAIRDRGDADWSSGAAANPNLLLEAEIAVVNTQTEFTLASGSDEDDAYNDQAIVLYDDDNSDFPSIRTVLNYVGATKTVTINEAPVFTLGADDSAKIFVTAPGSTPPTAAAIVDEWESQSQANPTGFHVNVKEVNDTPQTANDNGADINAILVDTNELQIDWVNGGRLDLLIDAIKAVTDNLPDSGALNDLAAILTDTGTTLPTTLAAINALVDDLESRLTAARAGYLDELTAANIPADIDTLLARITAAVALASVCTEGRLAELDAANLPADIAALNNLSAAQVNAEVDTALADIHLDHLLAVDYDPASKPGVATALLNEVIENDGGVSRFTENALEQAPSGTGASAATIADAVWDEAQADHVDAGTFGEIASEIASILTETGELQTDWTNGGRLDLLLDAIKAVTDLLPDAGALNDLAEILTDTGTTLPTTLVTIAAYVDELETRLTAARAGYLDKLNIGAETLANTGNASSFKATGFSTHDEAAVKTAIEAAGSHLALIKAVTDALTAAAAAKLALSAGTIVSGTVSHDNTAATTTVFYSDDITEATADHYKGRIVIFTSGALIQQATDITDYALDTGEGKFTVTALTEAPADNVTFIIV